MPGRGRGRTVFTKPSFSFALIGLSVTGNDNGNNTLTLNTDQERYKDLETSSSSSMSSTSSRSGMSSSSSSSGMSNTSSSSGMSSTGSIIAPSTSESDKKTKDVSPRFEYVHKNPLTEYDIRKIKANKPQNFNMAQSRGRIRDGFRACTYGCGEHIRIGDKFTSAERWIKNPNNLKHRESCPKYQEHLQKQERYAAFHATKPVETPTPAVYDEANRSKKTDIGFSYGAGPFLTKKRVGKKKTIENTE